jgi:outer membrane lipoprotein-sorting protein
MRWDYYETKAQKTNVKKSFISNGKTLFVVEHDNKQVLKKSLAQDLMPVAVTFLYGKGDLNRDFNAEIDKTGAYGGKGDTVLKLTPKQPSAQYKTLYLVVDPADGHVTQSVIVDSSNNVNQFRFFNADFKAPVKDSTFDFNPQSLPNYQVVDADQQAKQSGGGAAGAGGPAMEPPGPAPAPAPKK